jgi:hypothetical protein
MSADRFRWAPSIAGALLVMSLTQLSSAQTSQHSETGSDGARSSSHSSGNHSKSASKSSTKSSSHAGSTAVETPVSDNARRHFSQGVRYLSSQDAGRYEKAYREFKAAYADSPSWKILGNLGIAAHELERDGEAIDAFKAYLERSGKELSSDERKQFAEDLEVLQAGYSTVKIQTQPEGAWIIDERLPETGEPIINRYGPTDGELALRVRAGHHRIRAEINGFESGVWEFSDAPGRTSAHGFTLKAEGPSEPVEEAVPVEAPRSATTDSAPGTSGLRVTSYVVAGLGAVGLGLGTYFLIDAFDKQKHADEVYDTCVAEVPGCGNTAPSYDAAIEAQDAEGSAFTRARVSYIAGGALLATGVVLFLVSSPGSSEEAPPEATLTPWFSPTGVGLSGRF